MARAQFDPSRRSETTAVAQRRLAAALLAVAAMAAAPAAWAIEYLSVARTAVMYDAPSAKAKPLFAVARGTPVEQIVIVGGWVKVRDSRGDLAWMEKSQLTPQRTVIVRVPLAQVRSAANDAASTVFDAEIDVVMDLVAPAPEPGWLQVRHADGASGYVKLTQVWGG